MPAESHVEDQSGKANLERKQMQFNDAMAIYDQKRVYRLLGRLVALTNISLQVFLSYLVLPLSIGIPWQIVAFIVAYLLADFVNGLVHMFMDNNDNYCHSVLRYLIICGGGVALSLPCSGSPCRECCW